VPIIGTGGAKHGVLHTDVIPDLVEGQRVIYCGDLNKSGKDIEASTRWIIEQETGPLQWERLLLTPEQVREHRLLPKEEIDHRFADGGRVALNYEAEALGQPRILQMLRDRLDALMPEPLEHVRVREQQQRRDVARLLNQNGRRRGR
jgi:hypothetical protein